jgi:hypothetical protein
MNSKVLIKWGVYFCAVLGAIFYISFSGSASACNVGLIPSSQLDKCGDVDTLWLHLDYSAPGVDAAFFKIVYNHNYVTPNSVIKDPLLASNEFLSYQIYPGDSIIINVGILVGEFHGPGNLAGIVLTANNQISSTPISVDRSVLRDTLNQDIPHTNSSATIQIDCTTPTAQVNSPISGGVYGSMPTLTVHFHDNVGLNRGYYQIDGCTGIWTQLWSYNSGSSDSTINWTVPGVPEGLHTVYFKTTDDAGNNNGDTCTYSWNFNYDLTAPTVEVTSPPSGGNYTSMPSLNIHFHDNVGLNRGYYQIDGCTGVWTQLWSYNSGSSDSTINWTVPGVPEGLHTVYFKTTDDAGYANGDTCTYSWSFTYHLAFPKILLFPGSQLDRCADVDTLWIYADSSVVNMEGASFKISYDKSFITPTNVIKGPALSPPGNFTLFSQIYPDSILINLAVLVGHFSGSGQIIGIILTADHETALTFLSFDRSVLRDTMNQDIAHETAGAQIQVDCTVPTVQVTSPPSGSNYTSMPGLTIHFHDIVGLNRGYYEIDGCTGTWTQFWSYNSGSSDTTISWTVPNLPEGTHTIYFKATDDAGNRNNDTCTYSWSFTYRIASVSLFPSFQLDRCTNVDTVWIYADSDVVNMEAALFKIGYDKRFITPTNVIKGPALSPPGNFTLFSQIYPDSILINLAVLVGHFNGPGQILGIVLTADHETALTSLSFDRSVLRDTLNQDIPHTTLGGTVEIDCTAPTIPTLLTPPNGTVTNNNKPAFTWSSTAGSGGSYTLQYSTSSDFSSGVVTVSGLAVENYTPTVVLADGVWYWHVRSKDKAGNESNYQGTPFSFTVSTQIPALPVLLTPSNGSITNNNKPAFTWTATAGTGGTYTLQYSTTSDFSSGVVTVTDLSVASYTPVAGLADGVWYWHVKAKNQAGYESGYQVTPFMFTLDTSVPSIPVLLTPADGSFDCDHTPTFTWTKSMILAGGSGKGTGTDQVGQIATTVAYTLQYCLSPSFANPITIAGIAESSYTVPDSAALRDSTYYWRVEAVDLANNHSGYQAYSCRFSIFFLGDVNKDHGLTVADVVYMINYLFKGGPAPDPMKRGDVNHDGRVTIGDAVFLVNYLFRGGPEPVCPL